MAKVTKIDSNATSIRSANESSIGVLEDPAVWVELDPNSFGDFGGNITMVSRNPINSDRMDRKGVVTDLDASASFSLDFTYTNVAEDLQAFMFANYRAKGEAKNSLGVTTLQFAAANTNSRLTRSGTPALDLTTQFAVGDLVKVSGFSNPSNNGVFEISAVTSTTMDLNVSDASGTAATLVDESATGNVSIVQVGVQAGTGDIDVDTSGDFPALTSTTLDFTTMGVIPGEWIYVGGDTTLTKLGTANNNGYARVRTVAASRLEFDKTQFTMSTEANTTSEVQLFIGRVLKNETGSNIVRQTKQFERRLGANDDSDLTALQAEYIIGCVADTMNISIPTADKLTIELGYVGIDTDAIDENDLPATFKGSTTVADNIKSESSNLNSIKVPVVESDAFNTSSDFARSKIAIVDDTNSNPTALFGFLTELSLSVSNNASVNKAVGRIGGFEVTVGNFQVTGNLTAYFSDINAINAIKNNSDVTIDTHSVKNNQGISIDIPLLSLGDGRPNVTQDQPVTIPVTFNAATGSKIDTDLNHTMLMVFFDYLPDAASE